MNLRGTCKKFDIHKEMGTWLTLMVQSLLRILFLPISLPLPHSCSLKVNTLKENIHEEKTSLRPPRGEEDGGLKESPLKFSDAYKNFVSWLNMIP